MIRKTLPMFVLGAALLLPSCAHFTTPLDENLDETTLGDKVGRAEWQSVLGLVAWGDAGTKAAAADGGISTIRHADQEVFALGYGLFYMRTTTIVYGD